MLQPEQSQRESSPLKRSLLLSSLRRRLHLPSSPPSLLRRSIPAGTATQALPPVTPAAAPAPAPTAPAPAPAPAAPNSPYPGTAPAASVLRYPGGGAVPPQTPYNPYMQGGQPNGQPGWSVLTAVCRLKRTRSTTAWLLPVFLLVPCLTPRSDPEHRGPQPD